MNSDDPFFNSGDTDKTIIRRPTPGRQQTIPPSYAAPPPPVAQQPYTPAADPVSFPNAPAGDNCLANAAAKLFALIGQLRVTHQHNDVDNLHRQTIQSIQEFENNAGACGTNTDKVLASRYALCATIDETALNTPWGSNSIWSQKSMLSTFHQETSGGEKFFLILNQIQQQPAQNIDLLELMFTCLSLGFEGKYRIVEDGHSQVESLRSNLFQTIRSCRGDFEHNLSPNWTGIQTKTTVMNQVPLWVIGAFTAAVMVTIYAGFNYLIHQKAKPAIEQLENVNPESAFKRKGS